MADTDLNTSIDATAVSLRQITADTVRRITGLAVGPGQTRFVASNAVSLAQALFAPEAWYRAIYCGEEPVGFVMLYDESLRVEPPQRPKAGIWRFMIDARFQGKGIGKAALEQVVSHVRKKRLFSSLAVSYVPGEGSPEGFYCALGFRPTGEIDDGEIVLELALAPAGSPGSHPEKRGRHSMTALNEFLRKVPVEQHALMRSLDAVISKAAPALSASLKWGNLTYHGKKNVCALVSHKYHVNLQVWGGARLKDPRGLLLGTGKDMRHIRLVTSTDVDPKYIAGIVRQASRAGGA